jgi:hypothetical protein
MMYQLERCHCNSNYLLFFFWSYFCFFCMCLFIVTLLVALCCLHVLLLCVKYIIYTNHVVYYNFIFDSNSCIIYLVTTKAGRSSTISLFSSFPRIRCWILKIYSIWYEFWRYAIVDKKDLFREPKLVYPLVSFSKSFSSPHKYF